MLCIRPATSEFVVGASCDYSFIPEMCGTGRVVHLADSDDYCVVEMQPRDHEQKYRRPGRLTARRLAAYLDDWTTAEHRANARTAVVFRAGDGDAAVIAATIAESERFRQDVSARLHRAPQPHRRHPYWESSIAFASGAVEVRRQFEERAPFVLVTASARSRDRGVRLLHAARRLFFRCVSGRGHVYPWHPGWHDSRALSVLMADVLRDSRPVVVVADGATRGTDWLARHAPDAWWFTTPDAFCADESRAHFSRGVVFAEAGDPWLPAVLARSTDRIDREGRIALSMIAAVPGTGTVPERLASPGLLQAEAVVVRNPMPHLTAAWGRVVARAAMTTRRHRLALAAVQIGCLAGVTLVANLARFVIPGDRGVTTSALFTWSVASPTEAAHG
jgi:hypothetical protein